MSKDKKVGEIYILTNPSFPEWVKIGYSDDADNRAKQYISLYISPRFCNLLFYYFTMPKSCEHLHKF
ncbi:GIY-YIG nuclease family protein [Candidatus Saccharibacteria bacterium]|nr:GIY-YIG nuclease family protein [Candidatus Saccharibacteria bacterium]